jgi:hypothetical protein
MGMKRNSNSRGAALTRYGAALTRYGAVFFFSALLLGVPLAAFSQAMSSSAPVQGTISAVAADSVTVTGSDGLDRKILMTAATVVRRSEPAALDQVKPGDALGVAARRDGDSLIATNINIFAPQIWDGARKGQFGMTDGQVMTNALVTQSVKSVNGRVLTMSVDNGTAKITVPEGVPIHRLLIVKQSDLAVGQTVTIRVTSAPGGGLTATSIGIDKPAK